MFRGFRAVYRSRTGLVSALMLSGILYLVLILSSFPGYSIEMLGASFFYVDNAFVALNLNLFNTAGYLGIALSMIYSLLSGILIVNIFNSIKFNGLSALKKGSGIAPAFLAGGCAGCGAGLLGFVGMLGVVSALPFQGNGLKAVSIGLISISISVIGNPKTCSID